jgi:hypothetical protein
VRFHLPIFLPSAAQFSVPGQHQTNLLSQPRFSSRPKAKTVSAHDRIPRPRVHLDAAHPPCEPSRPPGCRISAPCVPYKSCSHNPNPRLPFLCLCLPYRRPCGLLHAPFTSSLATHLPQERRRTRPGSRTPPAPPSLSCCRAWPGASLCSCGRTNLNYTGSSTRVLS